MMSYPKHHCSQFPALTGIPYSSIAFSSNYNKTQSCFHVFLGPGGMGPHLLTHSPLRSQGRLLLAPWIPQHLVPTAKFPLTSGPLHSCFLCLKQFPRAFLYWLAPFSTGSFSSLRWAFLDHSGFF